MRLGDDGRLVVVRAAPPEDQLRLRATAETLGAAAGAGAVEVIRCSDDGEHVELVLAYAGRSPSAPMDAMTLARVGAAVAASAADLHLRGIAHGALLAEHVLVDAAGDVRLCGYGSSANGSTSSDVRAMGALLLSLLDSDDSSQAATTIRTIAERCTSESHPSMSAVAAGLAAAHGPRTTISRMPAPTRSRRLWPALAIVGVISIFGTVVLWPRGGAPSATAALVPSSTTTVTSTMTAPRATRVWPRPQPKTIEGDGARWAFGSIDDWALVGDFDCDGVDTPALVQRSSGDVWVIDAWPDGDEAAARYVTTINAVVDATLERGRSCDSIVVETAGGESIRPELRLTPA